MTFGSSLDLNCGALNVFEPRVYLEIIRMDGITQLTPDGYNVTMTGRIVTIHGLDPSMQGKVVCKLVSSCTKTRGDVDLGFLLPIPPKGAYICIKTAIDCWNKKHYLLLASLTSNNQRLGSASDVTRLSLLCQLGDDVIRPCKICGDARYASLDPFAQSAVPCNLESNLY